MRYRDLIAWQKAHANAIRTIKALDSMKHSRAADVVSRQLLRAVTSVGANIAEGYGRHTGKEYVRFLEIAYGSANETDNWLSVLRDAGLLEVMLTEELRDRNEEVLRILGAMLRKLKENRKESANAIKEDEEIYNIGFPDASHDE